MNSYFRNIQSAVSTLLQGLSLTGRHLKDARNTVANKNVVDKNYFEAQDGIITVQYPHESIPIPDNGRYRLHNEIDDCIVCDKCAKVCPVDCIEIDAIKDTEVYGYTSDGTPKRIHAARFDIDMGKCCFCGLCTTVCPTECLTMTKAFDFSEFDVADHTYSFANMTLAEIADKRNQLEQTGPETAAGKTERVAKKPMVKPRPKFK